jgi:hypothetical protein
MHAHPGSEGGELDLDLALSQSIWQLQAVPLHFSITQSTQRYVGYVAQIRYLRSIPRFNQKSKSHDFRLPSIGFVTRGSISLTYLLRTIPCPWFNCFVRPRLVPTLRALSASSGPWIALVSPHLHDAQASLHRAKFPNSQQDLSQSLISQRRPAPTLLPRGFSWGTSH